MLSLSSAAPDAVTEGGHRASQSAGMKYSGAEPGKAVFELASGSNQFLSKLP